MASLGVKGKAGKRIGQSLLTTLLRVLLAIFVIWYLVARFNRSLAAEEERVDGGMQSDGRHAGKEELCPPATIDWRAFQDPGPMFRGTAAIMTHEFTDMAIMWLVHSLQSLGYQVMLFAEPAKVPQANAFLARASNLGVGQVTNVQVQSVKIDGDKLLGSNVAMFIYICQDDHPAFAGLGTANILIMQPTQVTALPVMNRTVVGKKLESYDFLLYLSTSTYVHHLPKLTPVFEDLQHHDRLFPLVDILSLPAAPVTAPTEEMGITISMSRYDLQRRRLLAHALSEFSSMHRASNSPVQLVICSWLMPGIANDLNFLKQQVSKLNLSKIFEYRDDVGHGASYDGIAVQWHLYNPEEKPHFVATAAMPAGVWVLDCTGTLAQLKGVLYGDCPSLNELHTTTIRFLRQPDTTRHTRVQQVIHKSIEAVGGLTKFKMLYLTHRSFTSKIIRFFITSTQAAYRARMTPAIQAIRAKKANLLQKPERNVAVLVEARPHYAFLYVVLNAAWYLPGWKLHVVHSKMNEKFVKRLLDPYVKVTYHALDTFNVDIDDYNLLMKNASFWQWFDADHILLFQTDSLILRYGVEQYTKYDYVGAPWHQENERWSQQPLKAALPEGVGNGGFSMRSVKAMVEICTNYSSKSPIKEQEDVFFAVNIQNSPTLALAERQAAYRFCMEVPCVDLPEGQPLAVHAAWYYADHATMQRLLDTSLMGLLDCELKPRYTG